MNARQTPHSANDPTCPTCADAGAPPATRTAPPRRWLRISGITHATVVAYLALMVALGGAAFAATGGTFILGKSNSADAVTRLSNSQGTALSLSSPSGVAPLAVNRTTRVPNLNADLLDGRDSTGFLRLGTSNTATARTTLTNSDGVPLRLLAKSGSAPMTVDSRVRVANLNADLLDGLDSTAFVRRSEYDQLAARVAELEAKLADMTVTTVGGHRTVRFSDVNVQIVNGTGTTDGTPNGRGNLLIGYNAPRSPAAARTGSHYVVVGDRHGWNADSGLIVGRGNTAGAMATALGEVNSATGQFSTVVGGFNNQASGDYSTVQGGVSNKATGMDAAVSGGTGNTASGWGASVLGGNTRTVTGTNACHPSCS